jgi:hypothetical protein
MNAVPCCIKTGQKPEPVSVSMRTMKVRVSTDGLFVLVLAILMIEPGAPHLGQAAANSETGFEHSGHANSAQHADTANPTQQKVKTRFLN